MSRSNCNLSGVKILHWNSDGSFFHKDYIDKDQVGTFIRTPDGSLDVFEFSRRLYSNGENTIEFETFGEVLGAEYVDQSIQNADEFNRPLQELVTEYCWNEIWNRPGLDRKTRSIVNLAMITALNRPHELKLHIKGAINNGLTKDEIREIFLQTAIYCGVPAAIDSFRNAKEVFKEMGI